MGLGWGGDGDGGGLGSRVQGSMGNMVSGNEYDVDRLAVTNMNKSLPL